MPGVGLVRSKIRPSRWLSPKSKQSFTNRQLLTTVSSKRFCARCVNLVSKFSSDPYPEPANAPATNIPKNPYLSAIRLRWSLRNSARPARTGSQDWASVFVPQCQKEPAQDFMLGRHRALELRKKVRTWKI